MSSYSCGINTVYYQLVQDMTNADKYSLINLSHKDNILYFKVEVYSANNSQRD